MAFTPEKVDAKGKVKGAAVCVLAGRGLVGDAQVGKRGALQQAEEDEENVSDDDDAPRQVKVLQEIPAVMCMDASVLNTRRDSAMYSFTKNIDYSQITDHQKRRFLREKKHFKKLQ